MAGKYIPFEKYLRDLPSTQKEVTLSFAQIEGILKSKLPASAYEDNRWWEHETERPPPPSAPPPNTTTSSTQLTVISPVVFGGGRVGSSLVHCGVEALRILAKYYSDAKIEFGVSKAE
jgi:hypothetical protein